MAKLPIPSYWTDQSGRMYRGGWLCYRLWGDQKGSKVQKLSSTFQVILDRLCELFVGTFMNAFYAP